MEGGGLIYYSFQCHYTRVTCCCCHCCCCLLLCACFQWSYLSLHCNCTVSWSEACSQSFGESASVSDNVDHQQLLAEVVEKLQQLNELESRRSDSSLERNQASSFETSHLNCSLSESRLSDSVHSAPGNLRNDPVRRQSFDGVRSRTGEGSRVKSDCLPAVDKEVFASKRSEGSLPNGGHRWRDEGKSDDDSGSDNFDDDNKTPTPPHDNKDDKVSTPPCPPPHHVSQNLEPPSVTPPSAKHGDFFLHPDVIHQQFSCDVSMLPVPRIVCPSSGSYGYDSGGMGDAVSFALLGSDYTLDENVHLADMIALKYLGMSGVRSSGGGNPGESWSEEADQRERSEGTAYVI